MTKLLIGTILICGLQIKTSLPTIDIISVDLDIETIVRVECSKFDDSFDKQEKKRRKVRTQKDIESILGELKKLQGFDDRTATDTRAQIVIKYSDHVEIICADRFSIYQNGKCYTITDRLKEQIWR